MQYDTHRRGSTPSICCVHSDLWLYNVASAAFISCAVTVLILHKWTSRWMRCGVSQVHACGNCVFTKLQYMFPILTHLKSEYLQSKFQLRYHSVISNDPGLLHVGELTCGADLHFRVPSLFSSVPALYVGIIFVRTNVTNWLMPNGGKIHKYTSRTDINFGEQIYDILSPPCKYHVMFVLVCFFWPNSPQWARVSSFTRFLDHTQRRTTVGRTPLDEWSARRSDLYLTTQNTHNRQTSMPPVGFEPTISAGERPQTLRLRPRGYWGRHRVMYVWKIIFPTSSPGGIHSCLTMRHNRKETWYVTSAGQWLVAWKYVIDPNNECKCLCPTYS
jgi:hypothetical protein